MIYHSYQDVLSALKNAPRGQSRSAILAISHNRNLVKSSGANVTLVSGKWQTGLTIKEQLSQINLGLIARLNAKTGNYDGIGALGGLSERTTKAEFSALSPEQINQLAKVKDDIIIKNGHASLTTDINIIRVNNTLRETREELGNLGIYDYHLQPEAINLIEMPNIKDDNYIINIWNGQGSAWAITPYCHTLQITPQTLDSLALRSEEIQTHEKNSEASRLIKMPLFEALKRYGNYSGSQTLEDGRNAQTDYRYPHEWLSSWYIASQALNHNDDTLIKLMQEVQAQTPWKISFKSAANKMGKDLSFIAEVLKVKLTTVEAMEKIIPNTTVKQIVDKKNQY